LYDWYSRWSLLCLLLLLTQTCFLPPLLWRRRRTVRGEPCNVLINIKNRIDNIKKIIKDQNIFIENEEYYVSDTRTLNYLLEVLDLKYLYGNILGLNIFPQDTKARRLAEVAQLKTAYCLEGDERRPEVIKALPSGIKHNKVNARELVISEFNVWHKKVLKDKNEQVSSMEMLSMVLGLMCRV